MSYTVFDGLQWNSVRGLARFARQLRRHLEISGWQNRPAWHPSWKSPLGRVVIGELIEPLQEYSLRPDVSFFPHNVLPTLLPLSRGFRALVLHDLLFLQKQSQSGLGNLYRRLKLVRSIRKADVIVTVSEASRAEIQNLTGQALEVFVLPNCLAEGFARLNFEKRESRRRTPILLHFGGHTPSKNTRALIDAVGILVRSGIEIRLDVAAMSNQQSLMERWRVAAGLPYHALRILPKLSDAELIETYRQSDLHVMPSLGEGFGIPVIEAARSCTLNVLTPLQVFRELIGDAAIFASGFEAIEIAAAVKSALESNQQARIASAFTQSQKYVFDVVHKTHAVPAFEGIIRVSRRSRNVRTIERHSK